MLKVVYLSPDGTKTGGFLPSGANPVELSHRPRRRRATGPSRTPSPLLLEVPVSAPSTRRRRRAMVGVATAAALAAATLGASSATAVPGFTVGAGADRLNGSDRVETAVLASKQLHPSDGSNDAVLVSRDSLIDGLTASYLAGLKYAPILYTDTNSVNASTDAELKRLGVKNVWLVGGTAVISAAQEATLKASYGSVTRYGGKDRYDTAAQVAKVELPTYQPEKVFVANGVTDADALAAGPIAYARGYPVLLTEAGSVPGYTSSALKDLAVPDRIVVGGRAVVSDATYSELGATQRLAGVNRQETSTVVAGWAIKNANFTDKNIALVGSATQNGADALVAAPLAGNSGTPVLFIQGGELGQFATSYLKDHASNLDGRGWVFGGTAAVSDVAATQATAAAQ